MKNILLYILILLFGLNESLAQKTWYLQPTIGVNFTPIQLSESDPKLYQSGFSFGLLTGPALTDNWKLNFGLTVNQRYTSYSYEEDTQNQGLLIDLIGNLIGDLDMGGTDFTEVSTEYWTIDLPISVDYQFESGFFFTGGLFVNSTISANSNIKTTTHIPVMELIDLDNLGLGVVSTLLPQNGTVESSSDSKGGLNTTNVGLMGGFGAEVGQIELRLQYQYGFIEIRNDDFNPLISNPQLISFHLAYLFELKQQTRSKKLKKRYDLDLIK